MARLHPIHQPVVGNNRASSHQGYLSRAVNAAPAITMQYLNPTPSSSQTMPSPLTQPHPSLLPLLSYYMARHYAQQAEIPTSKQAPLAFRNPRLLHHSPRHSRSSGRNRLRSSSRRTSVSPTFQYILDKMAKRKSNEPSGPFHMTTRKRAKTNLTTSTDPSPSTGGDVDEQASQSSRSSSLSSVPSQIEVPETLREVQQPEPTQPTRSTPKRARDDDDEDQPSPKKPFIKFNNSPTPNKAPIPTKATEGIDWDALYKQSRGSHNIPDLKSASASYEDDVEDDGITYVSSAAFGIPAMQEPKSPKRAGFPVVAAEGVRQYFGRRHWPDLHTRAGLGARKAPIYYSADTKTRRTDKFRDQYQKDQDAAFAQKAQEAQQAVIDEQEEAEREAQEAEDAAREDKVEVDAAWANILARAEADAAKAAADGAAAAQAPATKRRRHIFKTLGGEVALATPGEGQETRPADNPDQVASANTPIEEQDSEPAEIPHGAVVSVTLNEEQIDEKADKSNNAASITAALVTSQAVDAAESGSQESPREGTPQKRAARGGRVARGRGRGGRAGRWLGRGRGKRAGDESPDPPHRVRNLSPESEDLIKKLRARQAELKRFFHNVGSQQTDILELMAQRDTQKLVKKSKAHKTVPEFDVVTEELRKRMEDTQQQIRHEYDFKAEYQKDILEKRKEVQEMQLKQRYQNLREEHLQAAHGEIALLKKAHAAGMDDTRTQYGSDLDFFPQYHEFPEPDATVRGYSARVYDERPFREALDSYDIRDVIDEDVLGPLRKELEERNRKYEQELEEKLLTDHKSLKRLSDEAIKQLRDINGYLIPKPVEPSELSAFSLSALADLAEWMAAAHPQKTYQYVPLAPGNTFPREALEFGPLPGIGRRLAPALSHVQPPLAPPQPGATPIRNARRRRRSPPPASPLRPQLNIETSMNGSHHPSNSVPSTPAPLLPAPVVSSGPGQPIAPAPPRPIASTVPVPPATFRHSSYSIPPGSRAIPSPSLRAGATPQQYVFQTPQQPQANQAPAVGPWGVSAGPRPPPSAGSPGPGNTTSFPVQSPFSAGPSPGSFGGFTASQGHSGSPQVAGHHQGKIPVQFINNTPAITRERAAKKAERRRLEEGERERRERERERERKGSGQSERGERVLLPKP